MLGNAPLVVIASTADLARAERFYGRVLGLRLVSRSKRVCVFDAAGATLRVMLVDGPAFTSSTVLGWAVPDLLATMRDLERAGVVFEKYGGPDGVDIWITPDGARLAWFQDPDGHQLSLTQQ